MRYLVAIDGSNASSAAVEHACTLIERTGGTVSLVHAVNPRIYSDPNSPTDDDKLIQSVSEAERRGERVMEEATEQVIGRDATLEDTHLLYGEPTEVIPDFATEEAFDGIVVGHRGLSDRYERVLGSVAKGLIGQTKIPVTVVRRD